MASKWVEKALGEVIELKRGFDLPQRQRQSGQVPIVSSSGIIGHHSEAKVKGPGVVTGRYGTLGEVFYIAEDFWPLNTALYVEDFKGNDPRFVSYFLRTINFLAYSDKAAVPGVNRNHLHTAKVLWPSDVNEQRTIAHILATLDNKIEVNRHINETLEEIARAIFTPWFGNTDPVRTIVSNLIVEEALEIGDGYRAKNDELGSEGLPFIRAGNLKNGFDTSNADRLKPESVVLALNKISRVGDVAFTSKGTIGRFARVGETTERFVYSPQICYWRSLDYHRIHPAVLYCWMQSDDFKNQVLAVAGQTDMAPYVSLKDQKRMSIPVFDDSQYEIGERITPLLARQSLNDAESRTLSVLRDSLLPKLISGELLVPVGAAQ